MIGLLRYRQTLIVLIAIAQIFSPVLFVPGLESFGVSVFRLLLVLTGAVLMLSVGLRPVSEWSLRALAAGAILATWLLLSLSWSPDVENGIRQLSYLLTVLLLIYILDIITRGHDDFLKIVTTVVLIGMMVIVLSAYELATGIHFFRSSIQDLAESSRSLNYISENQAWFTFGNPNDLIVHLAICCFVAILLFRRSVAWAIFVTAYFGVVGYLADALDARIVLLTLAVFAIFYAAASLQRRAAVTATLTTVMLVSGGLLLGFALIMNERAEFLDVSTFIRLQLVTSSIEMAAESLFVGVGAGGFESEMWYGGFIGRTYGIVNPHNGLARMLAENGVIGLALFGFLLLGPVYAISRARVASSFSAFVAASALGLPLLFSVGSDPLSSSSLQIALALLWIGCRVAVEEGKEADVAVPFVSGAYPIEAYRS